MSLSWNDYFTPDALHLVRSLIRLALEEDGPDMTALGVFRHDTPMEAILRAKQDSLTVGLPLVGMVLKELGTPFRWRALVREGNRVPAGTHVAVIHAPAVHLLRAERVVLNMICRMSGIANLTATYVARLEGTGVRLLDTRKTDPGMRWPEKYAVAAGGGHNHRRDLREMLMLKDNHIDAAGSITDAVSALRASYSPCPPIEVECRTLEHVEQAVQMRVSRIMMDNMTAPLLGQALALVPKDIEAEVSGNVTLDTIRDIALTRPRPPDFISVGRITHSAPSADFSMTLSTVR
ncbi:MAG: carboxylating nicotinate-nucleotide diphosphorylase [Desulfovibrio sp.]|jgi:nicotinate-nucleotide pyrophosphorylase (carboxylating)|nr:carboxylating nicotinate-nucleotide diphosphorylase [Desulfovibrio sp.]